jgi:hypothetical protein
MPLKCCGQNRRCVAVANVEQEGLSVAEYHGFRVVTGRPRWNGFCFRGQQGLSATDDLSNPPRSLTVEEVDHTLDRLASTCVFSSRKLRESITIGYTGAFNELVRILRGLPSVGVKWMIRLLLKNLCSVEIPVTTHCGHSTFLCPTSSKCAPLSGAVQLLEGDTIGQLPISPPPSLERSLKESTRTEIEPPTRDDDRTT